MTRSLSLCLILGMSTSVLFAQRPGEADTSSRPQPQQRGSAAAAPRPYSEVITPRTKTDDGLFKIHQLEENYLIEIPDSLLGRDILVVNRIAKAAAEGRSQMMGYAGDQIGENVIRFEKGPNNKIFLKNISFREFSRDTTENGMYRSVINSNVQPIAAAFDVKAYGRDSVSKTRSTVIDITSFANGDNDILFFDAGYKRMLSLGMQQNDRSYVQGVRSYPDNVEIRTVKTFIKSSSQGGPGGQQSSGGGAGGPATYELNSSLILLPKVPMQARQFDPRVGYFATGYTDFDLNPQGVERVSMITRWRLEPKAQDIEKYKKGELVEPAKPVVFYIDPSTPKKWVPYLMQGVTDWNIAFERAGWKNAIVAKEAPKNNAEWSLEDARHSAIVYKASDVPNASGPHVHDPRSGEILETHINWYHNVMQLVRNWYFIQAAAIDPRARTMKFDDELMGQLIRFVSSHEVGHTLGLRHNYGASSTVPVEKLRDKAWVEANGHTPSIMDYARFNYVAQPEDNISAKGIYPRIGEYDKWAIEWGYRWYPESNPEVEKAKLNQWTTGKLGGNTQLWFGTESDPNDPRGQNEDLGDNAMIAGSYGIKNLKRILPNILEWTKEENEGYANAKTIYNELVGQLNRYMGHVSKNIGGIMTTPRMIEEKGPVFEFVNKTTQKQAMQFLQQQLFTTPKWLLDKKLYSLTGVGDMNTIIGLQQGILNRLLSNSTLDRLLQAEAFDPTKAYTANEMIGDLSKGLWNEVYVKAPIDIYRRNLQKAYVERLISLVVPSLDFNPAPGTGAQWQSSAVNKTTDALSVLKGHMKSLAAQLKVAKTGAQDNATRLHLEDIYGRLQEALENKNS